MKHIELFLLLFQVQLTRTQVAPNGEEQRVTIERDFKNEQDLNKFLKEFEENLHQQSSKSNSKSNANSHHDYFSKNSTSNNKFRDSHEDLLKSPG